MLCRSIKLHIQYLLSMEDSERMRDASVRYVSAWLAEFYPYRPDLADELKSVGKALGGHPNDPRLSWKYQWLVELFGWRVGRYSQVRISEAKHGAAILWDRAMYRIENLWGTR